MCLHTYLSKKEGRITNGFLLLWLWILYFYVLKSICRYTDFEFSLKQRDAKNPMIPILNGRFIL